MICQSSAKALDSFSENIMSNLIDFHVEISKICTKLTKKCILHKEKLLRHLLASHSTYLLMYFHNFALKKNPKRFDTAESNTNTLGLLWAIVLITCQFMITKKTFQSDLYAFIS